MLLAEILLLSNVSMVIRSAMVIISNFVLKNTILRIGGNSFFVKKLLSISLMKV